MDDKNKTEQQDVDKLGFNTDIEGVDENGDN